MIYDSRHSNIKAAFKFIAGNRKILTSNIVSLMDQKNKIFNFVA